MAKEKRSRKAKNVWMKLTGPAAESLAKGFFGPAVTIVLQENGKARGGAAITPVSAGQQADRGEVDGTGRGAAVTTLSVLPTSITFNGPVQAGKCIKVLKTYRILLLGKTRAGKSSLANTIFEEHVFEINQNPLCKASQCQAASRSVEGRRITLIDTPGIFDSDKPEEELKREIVRCITECAPGPHAFLIVLKVEKFPEQQVDVVTKIVQYFSEEALKYATVVFTHGDQLPKGMKIEEYVDQNKSLSDLVKKCGGRCHVVDNIHWKNNQQDEYRDNMFQVAELLNTTDKLVIENKGKCYTNKMLEAANKEIQEEGNPTSEGNKPQGNTSNKANNSVSKTVRVKLTGPAAESLSGAFFGSAVVVLQETGWEGKADKKPVSTEEEPEESASERDEQEDEAASETDEQQDEASETEEEPEDGSEEEHNTTENAEEKGPTDIKRRNKEQKTSRTEKQDEAKKEKHQKQGGGSGTGSGVKSSIGGLFGFLFGLVTGAVAAVVAVVGAANGFVAGIAGAAATGAGATGALGGALGAGASGAAGASGSAGASGAGATGASGSAGASGAGASGSAGAAVSVKSLGAAAGVATLAAGISWVIKIWSFLKALPRRIGIILLVVVFYLLLLLSFGVQIRILGTVLLILGVVLLLLLLVLLLVLL